MKIKGQNLKLFLTKAKLATPFILVFGSDKGLVHESAKKIADTLLDDTKNQTAIISITSKDIDKTPSVLIDSASSLSLFYEKQIIVKNKEIFDFIFNRVTRTYNNIYLLVDRIDKLSLQKKRQLTIPLIKEIL